MKGIRLLQGAAATLAALGLLLPPTPVNAQDGAPAVKPAANKADAKLAADIVLQKGEFAGRVVDHQGAVLPGREVIVRQGAKEVARATTDKNGVFSIKNVRPGNYTASAGATTGNFRVWNEKTAPPSAKGHALLVMGENGARGQFGAVDPTLVLLTAAIIATLIISIVALDKINDVEDCCEKISESP
jgi:hypothetical protein